MTGRPDPVRAEVISAFVVLRQGHEPSDQLKAALLETVREGDVVWMRYEEGRVDESIRAFPGRAVYIAEWEPEASIEPYDPLVHR